MSEFLAVVRVAWMATRRRHAFLAGAALALAATALAPSLVAFAFRGADALAVEGSFGTAALFAPVASLLAAVSFASGERGGEGLAPSLRGSISAPSVVAAASAGIASACVVVSVGLAGVAFAALSLQDRPVPEGPALLSIAVACAATPAAAAWGMFLGVVAPRGLAFALAFLAVAAAAGPAPTGPFLLARDAAFGPLPFSVVVLAAAASLAAAGGGVAATTAALRVKDLAPGPAST
jgi:hypothetical protein